MGTPIEAAHIRLGSHAGMGEKPGDDKAIPLCGGSMGHHAEQHRIGEASFWKKYGKDPHKMAKQLWSLSPHRINMDKVKRGGINDDQ